MWDSAKVLLRNDKKKSRNCDFEMHIFHRFPGKISKLLKKNPKKMFNFVWVIFNLS